MMIWARRRRGAGRPALAALALLGLGPAFGSAPAAAVVFTVGVEDLDYYPQYTIRDGVYGGYAQVVLDAFAKARGHRFDYRPRPIRRLFQEFLSGALDFKYPDSPHWAGNAKAGLAVVYSAPVAAYIDGVMVRPERKGRGTGTIRWLATVAGFTPFAWLDQVGSGAVHLEQTAGFATLLRLCLDDEADGCYVNVKVAEHHLDSELARPGALVFDPGLPHVRDAYYLSTVRHAAVIDEFNAFLKAESALVASLKTRFGVE